MAAFRLRSLARIDVFDIKDTVESVRWVDIGDEKNVMVKISPDLTQFVVCTPSASYRMRKRNLETIDLPKGNIPLTCLFNK